MITPRLPPRFFDLVWAKNNPEDIVANAQNGKPLTKQDVKKLILAKLREDGGIEGRNQQELQTALGLWSANCSTSLFSEALGSLINSRLVTVSRELPESGISARCRTFLSLPIR